jgi:hypothetical protein
MKGEIKFSYETFRFAQALRGGSNTIMHAVVVHHFNSLGCLREIVDNTDKKLSVCLTN